MKRTGRSLQSQSNSQKSGSQTSQSPISSFTIDANISSSPDSQPECDDVDSVCDVDSIESSSTIEVMTPPLPPLASFNDLDNDDDDDDEMIVGGPPLNANAQFDHAHQDCANCPAFSSPETHCEKCYCFVCNTKVSECNTWSTHCFAKRDVAKWEDLRANAKQQQQDSDEDIHSITSSVSSPRTSPPQTPNKPPPHQQTPKYHHPINKKNQTPTMLNNVNQAIATTFSGNLKRILELNESSTIKKSVSSTSTNGEVTTLQKKKAHFCNGIHIGWPFAEVLPPQRQMAAHIITGLKNRNHVILESPTGTGKSVAILTACLAFQRYHNKKFPDKFVRIIYTSRTHSQVKQVSERSERAFRKTRIRATTKQTLFSIFWLARLPPASLKMRTISLRSALRSAQMVASLKKTPYRPRSTILGSREHMCINEDLKPADGSRGTENLSTGCQNRKKNEESLRKSDQKNISKIYDDNDPPRRSLDKDVNFDRIHISDDDEEEQSFDNDNNGMGMIGGDKPNTKCTCQHYRNLTSARVANFAIERFRPNLPNELVESGVDGGEDCKMGVGDIEDLVDFGRDLNSKGNVAIYRTPLTEQSFGMKVSPQQHVVTRSVFLRIDSMQATGAVAREGTLEVGDEILAINGRAVVDLATFQNTCKSSKNNDKTNDPIVLNVRRAPPPGRLGGYALGTACPYYLSQGERAWKGGKGGRNS